MFSYLSVLLISDFSQHLILSMPSARGIMSSMDVQTRKQNAIKWPLNTNCHNLGLGLKSLFQILAMTITCDLVLWLSFPGRSQDERPPNQRTSCPLRMEGMSN